MGLNRDYPAYFSVYIYSSVKARPPLTCSIVQQQCPLVTMVINLSCIGK